MDIYKTTGKHGRAEKERKLSACPQHIVSQKTKLSDEFSKAVPLHKIAGSVLEVNFDTCKCW